jgi:hypothetical protein
MTALEGWQKTQRKFAGAGGTVSKGVLVQPWLDLAIGGSTATLLTLRFIG